MSHFAGVHFTGVHFSPVQYDTLDATDGEVSFTSVSTLTLEAELLGSRELPLPCTSTLVLDGVRLATGETLDLTTTSTLRLEARRIGQVWIPVPKDESERWTPVTEDRVDIRALEEEET